MNQFNQRILVDPLKVGQAFKPEIAAVMPVDSAAVITAVNRGTPLMLNKDIAAARSGKAFIGVVEAVRQNLAELQQPVASSPAYS